MNPIFESAIMYNPINTAETYGGQDGLNITEVRSDFDFRNFTAQNFKPDTWEELKNIFNEAANNVWEGLYNLIVDKENNPKVVIKSTTCKCQKFKTSGNIICPDNTPNLNRAGIAYRLLDGHNYNDYYKNIEVHNLYLHVKQDIDNVNIFIYSAQSGREESKPINLKKGKNDLIKLCGIKQPFLLDPTKTVPSYIALIPSQFIVSGQSTLNQTIVPCPSCVMDCKQEYKMFGTSDISNGSKYILVSRGANVNNYGFEIVTSAVCDVARIIEDNTTKFQLASLQAIYMMAIFARNSVNSNNINSKIVFGKQASAADAKAFGDAYSVALHNVANTVFNKVADGAKSDCILCRGRVVGRSSF